MSNRHSQCYVAIRAAHGVSAEGRRWVGAWYSIVGLTPKLAGILERAARRGT